MVGLYFAYLRELNVLRQQQVAMSLMRHFGHEKYLRWAVLNMELQNHFGSNAVMVNAKQRSRLLQLADMMLDKQEKPSLHHAWMHLRVLTITKQFDKAKTLLQSKEMGIEMGIVMAGVAEIVDGDGDGDGDDVLF